jgi:hypothetical protein
MRDRETIDSELRLVAALRRAARERGGPLRRSAWPMCCWMNVAPEPMTSLPLEVFYLGIGGVVLAHSGGGG